MQLRMYLFSSMMYLKVITEITTYLSCCCLSYYNTGDKTISLLGYRVRYPPLLSYIEYPECLSFIFLIPRYPEYTVCQSYHPGQ